MLCIAAFQSPVQRSPSRAGVAHSPAALPCAEIVSKHAVLLATSVDVPRRWQKVPSRQRSVRDVTSHPMPVTAVWHVPVSEPEDDGTHAYSGAQMSPVHGSSEQFALAPT